MKRTVIYPGSFNPMHIGHVEVIQKSIMTFDEVIVAIGVNPDKQTDVNALAEKVIEIRSFLEQNFVDMKKVQVTWFRGFLPDFVSKLSNDVVAVVRGLRNGQDFEIEKTQQYWYEDLGLLIPVVYIIAERYTAHYSSSALRMIDKLKAGEEK